MSKKRLGFTLVELIIGIVIMSILGLAIYKLVSAANRNSAIAECKGNLRLSASLSARYLERDVSTSRAIIEQKEMMGEQRAISTIKSGTPEGPDVVSMWVPKNNEEDIDNNKEINYFTTYSEKKDIEKELYEEVKYTLNNHVLSRNGTKIADNIGSITFKTNSADNIETTYDGKTQITISAVAKPYGVDKEYSYVQEIIVAIRQLQIKRLKDRDKDNKNLYWKQRVDENNY